MRVRQLSQAEAGMIFGNPEPKRARRLRARATLIRVVPDEKARRPEELYCINFAGHNL